jgi:hypothetical protein
MKKTFLIVSFCLIVLGSYAQGNLQFNAAKIILYILRYRGKKGILQNI